MLCILAILAFGSLKQADNEFEESMYHEEGERTRRETRETGARIQENTKFGHMDNSKKKMFNK